MSIPCNHCNHSSLMLIRIINIYFCFHTQITCCLQVCLDRLGVRFTLQAQISLQSMKQKTNTTADCYMQHIYSNVLSPINSATLRQPAGGRQRMLISERTLARYISTAIPSQMQRHRSRKKGKIIRHTHTFDLRKYSTTTGISIIYTSGLGREGGSEGSHTAQVKITGKHVIDTAQKEDSLSPKRSSESTHHRKENGANFILSIACQTWWA